MLLVSKIVHVPAQREVDADLSEYGSIGIKLCAAYGEAAAQAGAPDFDSGAGDVREGVTDVIANLLHFADREGLSASDVIDSALNHYHAERSA